MEELTVTANKKELGLAFKRDAKAVADALEALPEDEADCLRKTLESGVGSGRGFVIKLFVTAKKSVQCCVC